MGKCEGPKEKNFFLLSKSNHDHSLGCAARSLSPYRLRYRGQVFLEFSLTHFLKQNEKGWAAVCATGLDTGQS